MSLAPGVYLGPFEILRLLGTGGMGEVYLARDPSLERELAIKIIATEVASDPDRLRRFHREARTASSLNHPNIAHVYEIGEADGHHYIAMEYVRGESLAQRIDGKGLPPSEVIVYATQIADALDEAHAHGVIHRDIKPANIIISARHKLKVLDFGLAKVEDEHLGGGAGSTHQGDTVAGLVLGTIEYMSPEQVRGHQLDRRSDIFSFGTVLYEMITGRMPFTGTTRTDTVYRITQAQPDPVTRLAYDVPADLDRIVRKCLEKEPARRYQTTRDLLVDLKSLHRDSSAITAAFPAPPAKSRWLRRLAPLAGAAIVVAMGWAGVEFMRAGRSDVVDSLAVVPVVAADASADTADLTRGLAASLINSLSDLPNLRIAPRRLSFVDGGSRDPLALARQLGVHAALTVELTRRGDMATLTIDLQDADHPDQLWGLNETKKLSEIETAQEAILDQVVDTLELRFSPEDLQEREAFRLYERGRIMALRRTETDVRKAIEFYEQALTKKRDYALAYAGLAQGYNLLPLYSAIDPQTGYTRARQSAQRALDIDPNLAEAHTQLGWVRFRWDWDWPGAEEELRRGTELDAYHAMSRLWLGDLLMAIGRQEEGLAQIHEAQKLDPLNPVSRSEISYALFIARRFKEAVADATSAIDAFPESILPRRYRALALSQLGRGSEAIDDLKRAQDLNRGPSTLLKGDLAYAYGAAGRRDEATRLFGELFADRKKRYVSPYSLAVAAAGLRDTDRTMEWLQRAFLERANMLVWVNEDARFDFLRRDARFSALISDLRLPPKP